MRIADVKAASLLADPLRDASVLRDPDELSNAIERTTRAASAVIRTASFLSPNCLLLTEYIVMAIYSPWLLQSGDCP